MSNELIPTTKIAVFRGRSIRKILYKNEWFFSVTDVIAALTESENPRDYWYKMKIRVGNEEKAQLSTFCRQLKLESTDGKKYETDCANTESMFRRHSAKKLELETRRKVISGENYLRKPQSKKLKDNKQ